MQRAYFSLCLLLGRLLRAGRYSTVHSAGDVGGLHVRKYRRFYAPLLVFPGGALVRIIGAGVRVLPQHEWELRERRIYRELYRNTVYVERDGVLILPHLPGHTLASLLEDAQLDHAARTRVIELAVSALVAFHHRGFTHGDAMAENVMVDENADVAYWFDFETVHDPERPLAWRRADDLRALLATCLLRTVPAEFAATLNLIVERYDDADLTALLHTAFAAVWQCPLMFHLGQAPLSLRQYREIAALLARRTGGQPLPPLR